MRKNKILVVDDDKDLVNMLVSRLKVQGYEVIPAYDGAEALRMAGSESPDLILLDIIMPVLDGLTVLRRLREAKETKETPIIMITAKGTSRAIFEAQGLGTTDYIIKPINLEELLKIIARYV